MKNKLDGKILMKIDFVFFFIIYNKYYGSNVDFIIL